MYIGDREVNPPEPRHPVECADCGVVMDRDDEDSYQRCVMCDAYLCDDCATDIDGETMCESCWKETHFKCDICDAHYPLEERSPDGLCQECQRDADS